VEEVILREENFFHFEGVTKFEGVWNRVLRRMFGFKTDIDGRK
jgi:hypothetical protein